MLIQNGVEQMNCYDSLLAIKKTSRQLYSELMTKFNNDLSGKCIIASDELARRLTKLGIKAETHQCWCLYECFEGCSNYCFEEHWVVRAKAGSQTVYIDLTISQFQWAFTRDIGKLYIGAKLPKFLLHRKPGRDTLKKCGWTDWYNTGSYVNNFEYY